MLMKRTDLVAKLATVAPALAQSPLIPVLTHFWFTGNEVLTHNDQIALSIPLKTEFAGAVPGTLLELLNRSKARDVELLPGEQGSITVKAASSKLSLGLLPPDHFLFEMPAVDDGMNTTLLDVPAKDFLEALELCSLTVGRDASIPEQLGVTLLPRGKKHIELVSLNGPMMTAATVACKNPISRRVTLHGSFCEQLLKMVGKDGKLHLEIGDDYSLATGPNGEVLFGRLIDVERPVDFSKVLDTMTPTELDSLLVPIPTKFKLILERALVVLDDTTKTEVSTSPGRMKFVSKSGKGEVIDSMQVGENHPEISVSVNPKYLKVGYGSYDSMLVTEACVIMSGPAATFYVAVGG